jgi:hypothetical protein
MILHVSNMSYRVTIIEGEVKSVYLFDLPLDAQKYNESSFRE